MSDPIEDYTRAAAAHDKAATTAKKYFSRIDKQRAGIDALQKALEAAQADIACHHADTHTDPVELAQITIKAEALAAVLTRRIDHANKSLAAALAETEEHKARVEPLHREMVSSFQRIWESDREGISEPDYGSLAWYKYRPVQYTRTLGGIQSGDTYRKPFVSNHERWA